MRRPLVLALLGAVMLYFALIAAAEYAFWADVSMTDAESAACVERADCQVVTKGWLRELVRAAVQIGMDKGKAQCPKVPTT